MADNASTEARRPGRDAVPEARVRAHIVNFALAILLCAIAVSLVPYLYEWLTNHTAHSPRVLFTVLADALLVAVVWALNRRGHTRGAAIVYVIGPSLVGAAGVLPTLDRMLAIYAVPIVLASFVLRPSASFPAALFTGLSYTLAFALGDRSLPYNTQGIISLFVVALLAWRIAGLLQDQYRRQSETEAALRKSEDKFRSFLEQSEDAIVLSDEAGRVTDWSRGAERIFGLERTEALGQSLWDVQYRAVADRPRTPEAYERIKAIVMAGVGTGQAPTLNRLSERIIQRSDGARCAIQVLSFPIKTENGYMLGSITRDITERKRIEEQARLDEARLQSLFDISQHQAASDQELLDLALQEIINLTGSKLAFINRYDEERALFTFDSWSRDVMSECGLQERKKVRELDKIGLWGEAVRQRKPIIVNDYAAPHPHKRGFPAGHLELSRFMAVPVFVQGRIVAVIGLANKHSDYDDADVRQCSLLMDTVWGIAERRRAEQALREKTAELETYFLTALDLFCIADTDGYFRRLNKAWEDTLGYSTAELEGQRFLDFVHPDDVDATLQAMTQLTTQAPVLNFVNRYRCKDGSYRWIEWRSAPVGKAVFAAARDITERKVAEEKRLEMERHLQQAQRLESLGVLAGGIAHDFNNLLTAILGHAELALTDVPPASTAGESLLEIERATQRAADLTRQMLAYAGRGHYVLDDVDLRLLIEEMAQLLKMTISKRAALQLNLKPGLPHVRADASQLRQIVMNLIINASEAIGERNGTITVNTDTIEIDGEHLRDRADAEGISAGRYVYLEVVDDGCGMDAETQKRIFDPFFSTKFTGRGLGLAAVQGIVRAHKGLLELNSEPGRGTTFRVLLPALPDQEQPKPARAGEDEWRSSGTILLVDDESTVRNVGERMLRRQGFDVLTAADGEAALEVYRAHCRAIRAVVLDMTMPRMDGAETFRALRQLDPKACVILSSGYGDEIAGSLAGEGLAGFVQKPYNLANLAKALQAALEPA